MEKEGNYKMTINNHTCLVILLVVHCVQFFVLLFRMRDIKLHGKPDVNGVLRAQKESMLHSSEYLVICLITGYLIKHLVDNAYYETSNHALVS